MARLFWPGSTFNQASITSVYLEDANGNQFMFLNCLGGDISVNPAKVGRYSSKVIGFPTARLQGEVEDGALTIPLKVRSLTATFGTAAISLLDILAQNDGGLTYVPITSISAPAVGNFPATVIYSDPLVKTWKIVIDVNTAPIDQAPYIARLTAYPMIPTPDLTLANVGADSTIQIAGVVDDPRLLYWTAV